MQTERLDSDLLPLFAGGRYYIQHNNLFTTNLVVHIHIIHILAQNVTRLATRRWKCMKRAKMSQVLPIKKARI